MKRLYEDVQSDSEADKEVQNLMSQMGEEQSSYFEDDNTSVVSGSWSKMRAYKAFNEHLNNSKLIREIPNTRLCAKIEKGTYQTS